MSDTNTATIKTIDITPVGCRTPEGVVRVNATFKTLEDSRVEMANKAYFFFREYGDILKELVKRDEEMTEEITEIIELGKTMNDNQEEFMLALGGRPSRKRID